jgi:hypothetical protein
MQAFYGYRCECYRAVVILAGYFGVLGHRDYGGLLETCWYYRMGQGEVENLSGESGWYHRKRHLSQGLAQKWECIIF